MDRGVWQAAVHGVTKSPTWLKWLSTVHDILFCEDILELCLYSLYSIILLVYASMWRHFTFHMLKSSHLQEQVFCQVKCISSSTVFAFFSFFFFFCFFCLVLFISPQGWTFFYNSTRMDFSWDALQRHPIFLPSSFLSLFFPLLPFHLPFFFDFFVFFFLSPSRLSSFIPYVHLFCDMCALKLVLHMLYLVFCYFNSDSDCSVCLFRICTVIMCLH